MYCKICDKPIPPQFDLCFEHRQEKLTKEFASLLEQQRIERLKILKLDCECNTVNSKVSIKEGKKYTKINKTQEPCLFYDSEERPC